MDRSGRDQTANEAREDSSDPLLPYWSGWPGHPRRLLHRARVLAGTASSRLWAEEGWARSTARTMSGLAAT